MRTGLAALVLGMVLGWTAPARAQTLSSGQDASSFFTGVDPRNIVRTPIDTSSFYRQFSSQIIRTPQQPSAFNLSNLFHRLPMLSWPPRLGTSTPPNPQTNALGQAPVVSTPSILGR
jgi:hypothetical protein